MAANKMMNMLQQALGVRGNENLKAPEEKEYVSQEVMDKRFKEYEKICDDISYFAQKYFYIVNQDTGKGLIKLYPKQQELLEGMTKYKRVICLACRQCGKCFHSQSLMTIRNKKTGKIEEITVENFFNRFKNS